MLNNARHIAEMTPETLCKRLKEYWAKEGYVIEAHVVQRVATLKDKRGRESKISCFEVASNLVNGLPRGYTGTRVAHAG